MATHVMTPARRAALRKAQLASAARRRRGGVGAQAKRAIRQKGQYAAASTQVAARRHVGSQGFKKNVKKGLKYTAYGLGGAAVIAAGAAGATKAKQNKNSKLRANNPYIKTPAGKMSRRRSHENIKRASRQGRHPIGKQQYKQVFQTTPSKRRAYPRKY